MATNVQNGFIRLTQLLKTRTGNLASLTTIAKGDLVSAINEIKQASNLVSGTTIKTINGNSILGSGNLTISGGSATTNASLLVSGILPDARLSSNIVNLTTAQTLLNKTINGVSPTIFGYIDVNSSIQTQLNAKQPLLVSGSTIKSINGISLLGSGNLVISSSIAAITGDVSIPSGGTVATLATINGNIGTFGSSTSIPVFTVNGKGLITGVTSQTISGGTVTTSASDLTSGTLSDARLSGNVVTLTGTQNLTGKTVNGVSPSTFAFLDPTSSVQTQLNNINAVAAGIVFQSNSAITSYTGTATNIATTDGRNYTLATSSATPDGITVLPVSGQASKRWLVKNTIITSSQAGAVGDGVADDTAAIQALFNITGDYQLVILPGNYKLTSAITRTNKGKCTVIAYGATYTFAADTNGLSIVNPLNGNLGTIALYGLTIKSTGVKTSRTALLIVSQEFRPGVIVEDVSIPRPPNQSGEWVKGYDYLDCIGISSRNTYVEGDNVNGNTIGYTVRNTAGRPCYEHKFIHPEGRGLKRAMDFVGATTGGFGIEGVVITDGNFVGVYDGIFAKTYSGSPQFQVKATHVNAFGGKALSISGYNQVAFSEDLFYGNKQEGGSTIPTSVIELDSVLTLKGDAIIVCFDNIPNAVELTGSGGDVNLDLQVQIFAAPTNSVKVAAGYYGTRINTGRLWNGNTTWGTTQGVRILDLSNSVTSYPTTEGDVDPSNGTIPTFTTDFYGTRYNYPDQSIYYRTQLITATTTIDPTLTSEVLVHNGSTAVVVNVDQTKAFKDKTLFIVRRYDDTDTGDITVRFLDNSVNKIQSPVTWGLVNSITVPKVGNRSLILQFLSGHLQIFSATPELGTAAFANTGAFIPASNGKLVASLTTTVISTTGWDATAYNEIVAPNALTTDTLYLVKALYNKVGVETINHSWLIPTIQGNPAASGVAPDYIGNYTDYNISTGRYVKLRAKKGTSGQTIGLEATLSNVDMADGTVTFYFTPLL